MNAHVDSKSSDDITGDVSREDRFAFGDNWRSFLETLDEDRIVQAERSLVGLLSPVGDESPINLKGKRFLDIGSGSGLFSLAAYRLGAKVESFDYDQQSVQCTLALRERVNVDQSVWRVGQGSVLDVDMMNDLGTFDIVYSWGVLHHTGEMNRAIELASQRVSLGGWFALAIYNHQGAASRRWHLIKLIYNRLPVLLRPVWVAIIAGFYELKFALARFARGKNPLPFADWRAKKLDRGMSAWHDWVDWVGGLPFEVAKPEQVIEPLRAKGFVLERLRTVGNGWGCNEFLFRREG